MLYASPVVQDPHTILYVEVSVDSAVEGLERLRFPEEVGAVEYVGVQVQVVSLKVHAPCQPSSSSGSG